LLSGHGRYLPMFFLFTHRMVVGAIVWSTGIRCDRAPSPDCCGGTYPPHSFV
jgi:hypothetical protein